ncbi:hypothetical protein BY996DRAFT_4528478, partial [Phakopsora pachyrhizi]
TCFSSQFPVFSPTNTIHLPPQFSTFLINSHLPKVMNPSSIIMNNEIQEISGKEYKRNLEDARKVATHLAQAFQSMPLPRYLFLILILLEYETTGEIPEDEQIQVQGPTISTTEELSRRLRKGPTPPKAKVDTSPPPPP